MEESIKIPKERIAVLIGKNGAIKKEIEQATKTRLNINSKTGEVQVSTKLENALQFYIATQIIKAIARGFSPEKAFKLLDEDYYLDVIDIEEFTGKREKEIINKKGRVIGKQGKIREKIEEETECFISVFGKTISIIGKPENMELCRKTIEMLLGGASINNALNTLERKKQEISEEDFEL